MKKILLAMLVLSVSTLGFAQKTVTGRHGSTATGTASRSGSTVEGSGTTTGTVTGARGNTKTIDHTN